MSSITYLPPSIHQLIDSFNELDKNGLSVGARALAKHFHRSTALFWGNVKGNTAQQNNHATQMIIKLLCDCAWINAHLIPHDIPVFEIRNKQGYGARWRITWENINSCCIDKVKFRGFLEPPDPMGHENGWKH